MPTLYFLLILKFSISELNIVSYVDSHEEWDVYSKQLFQIHVFEDETTLHRKIKIKAI